MSSSSSSSMSMSSLPAVAQQELNARRKLKRCRGELDEEDMKDEKKEEKKESKEAKEVKKEEKKKVASLDDVQDLDMEVTLKSSNDKEHGFVVTRRQACISSLLKTSLENDSTATFLDLGVKQHILAYVVKYLIHCNGQEPPIIEKPLRSRNLVECVHDKWDARFIYGHPVTGHEPKEIKEEKKEAKEEKKEEKKEGKEEKKEGKEEKKEGKEEKKEAKEEKKEAKEEKKEEKKEAEWKDDMDRQDLYDLILAFNYMDIKSALHLGCARVASLIKGQPLEKVREILDKDKKAEKKAAEKKEEKKEQDVAMADAKH